MDSSSLLSHFNVLIRFHSKIDNYRRDLLNRCMRAIVRYTDAQLFVLEYSSKYLDLAVPPPSHIGVKRQARKVAYRRLPYLCAEFFLAETVPQNRVVVPLFDDDKILKIFNDALQGYSKEMFVLFDDEIVSKISQRYPPHQKKEITQRYLRAYRRSSSIDRFCEMFSYLLDLCIKLDCELTIDVLTTFCDTVYKKLSVFYLPPRVSSFKKLILHAKKMRFDFWGLWSGDGNLPLNFDFIHYFGSFYLGQKYSKILLKYGFPYMAGPAKYVARCDGLKKIKFKNRTIIQSVDVFSQHADSEKRTRMMLIMDTFLIFADFEGTADTNDRIKTLTYLTRSLPLPYVTPTELYNTMIKAVVPDFEPQLRAIVSRYANSDIIEDDSNTLEPRRLMHLCRVTLRKILADNFKLLDGIQELGIPTRIQTYLELES